MGLFDDVRCDMPLPADPAPPAGVWFQTKTFEDPYLEKYVIQTDGRLMHYVSEKALAAGDGRDTKYHGDLDFYDRADDGEWWRYVARFTDGFCVRITCVEHCFPDTDGAAP